MMGHKFCFVIRSGVCIFLLVTPAIFAESREDGGGGEEQLTTERLNNFSESGIEDINGNQTENNVDRARWNVDEDLDNWVDPPEYRRNYPYVLAGYDFEKRPVWMVEAGRFNFRKILEQGPESVKNFERYTKKAFGRFGQSIKEQSTPEEPVTGMVFVVDLDNFSFYQLVHVPTVTLLLRIVRENVAWFAKHLEKMLILNTNAFAHTLVNLGRPIMGRIMEKVDVYGTQKAKWIPLIRQHIPKESLPEFYGGSKNFRPVQIYG